MWWMVGAAVGVVGLFLLSATEEEQESRTRWTRDHERIQRSVEEHRRNIQENLGWAQESYEYRLLLDLHHSSFRVADEAYKLREDARTTIATYRRMIDEAKSGRVAARERQHGNVSDSVKHDLNAQIANATEVLDALYPQVSVHKDELERLNEELHRLNEQTRLLKETIRDRCGARGRDWYDRLQARSAARRFS